MNTEKITDGLPDGWEITLHVCYSSLMEMEFPDYFYLHKGGVFLAAGENFSNYGPQKYWPISSYSVASTKPIIDAVMDKFRAHRKAIEDAEAAKFAEIELAYKVAETKKREADVFRVLGLEA